MALPDGFWDLFFPGVFPSACFGVMPWCYPESNLRQLPGRCADRRWDVRADLQAGLREDVRVQEVDDDSNLRNGQ